MSCYKNDLIFIFLVLFFSCHGSPKTEADTNSNLAVVKDTVKTKPPSYLTDTLYIQKQGVVFFLPDSNQMDRIKAVTEAWVFDGTMHECYYQIRNSKIVMNANWKDLQIYEAYKYRYLLFIKSNTQEKLIDLNKINDPCGAFAFNLIKDPEYLDMTNIEQGIYYYFKK